MGLFGKETPVHLPAVPLLGLLGRRISVHLPAVPLLGLAGRDPVHLLAARQFRTFEMVPRSSPSCGSAGFV